MNETDNLKLAEILCSRICHDLIGPVSAINNGLEFLDPNEGDLFQNSLEIVHTSAQQAIQRLTFFRLVLGARTNSQAFALDDVCSALSSYLNEHRIDLERPSEGPDSGVAFPRNSAKALMFSVLLALDCLPRGGVIRILSHDWISMDGMSIYAQGDRCLLREDVRSGLDRTRELQDITVRNVFAYMAATFVNSLQKELKIEEISENEIEFSVI
tara:strand:- start:39 stop:677 length:639 start_codon:yes stop_codon:yes gene_type:complete